MKHVHTFESFLNEANLSDEAMNFQTGDAIIVTKTFVPTDLDFRKSATSFWGQKVASLKNMWAKEGVKNNPNRTYKAGDPLFVFTKPAKLDSKGMATIYGYAGYFFGDFQGERNPDDFALSAYDLSYPYNDMMTQTVILAILGGYAKVAKYSDINAKERIEFEALIKKDRVTYEIIGGNTVTYDGMEIHKYDWTKQGYVFSGFDEKTGNEVPKRLVKFEDVVKGRFFVNGKEITNDPFKP